MKLLLAEDDPMIGASMEQGLRMAGFAVDWVRDGKAAEIALDTGAYALLLDLGLPRQDGLAGNEATGADLPGSGLGLAIVREIVALHRGNIALHDTPGGGLTVRIALPVPDPLPPPA